MGYFLIMRSSSQKENKLLDIDSRGRITVPKECRNGVDAFKIESLKDGALKLIPHQIVSAEDAKILEIIKSSARDFKAGRIKKIQTKWLQYDDATL